jgi:hypothetical protein
MHTYEQLGAQLAGLQHRAGVACGSTLENEVCVVNMMVPWWLKSKQPSIQMRSSLTLTSSWGPTGHWPSMGTHSPCNRERCFLGWRLGLWSTFALCLRIMAGRDMRLSEVSVEEQISRILNNE